jgi:hypothetical protein
MMIFNIDVSTWLGLFSISWKVRGIKQMFNLRFLVIFLSLVLIVHLTSSSCKTLPPSVNHNQLVESSLTFHSTVVDILICAYKDQCIVDATINLKQFTWDWDECHYRKSFIKEFEKLVKTFDERKYTIAILNNDFRYIPNMDTKPITAVENLILPREKPVDSSSFGREMARLYFYRTIIEKIKIETDSISKFYFLNDIKRWRKWGIMVPEKELSARLSMTPYLKSMMYLKNKFIEMDEQKPCDCALVMEIF